MGIIKDNLYLIIIELIAYLSDIKYILRPLGTTILEGACLTKL